MKLPGLNRRVLTPLLIPLLSSALAVTPACSDSSSSPPPPLTFPLNEVAPVDTFLDQAVDARVWDPGSDVVRRQGIGLLFVGGIDGGYIQPGDAIYSRLAAQFSRYGAFSVFVKYRHPGELEDCVEDALRAARLMEDHGVRKILVIGWSFGGAVGIHTASQLEQSIGFIGLSPQSLLTEPVSNFSAKKSLLLIHSKDDENIPFWSSEQILEDAPPGVRKRLIPLEGFDHALDHAGNTLLPLLTPWIEQELGLRTSGNLGGGWMPNPE